MLIHPLSIGPLVGATTSHSFRIWARVGPDSAALGVRIKKVGADCWTQAEWAHSLPQYDHTAVVQFSNLEPGTRYLYQAVAFSVVPFSERSMLENGWPDSEFEVSTFPRDTRPVSFLMGSCRHHGWTHVGMVDPVQPQGHASDKAFGSIEAKLRSREYAPQFLLLMGNQVYADMPFFVSPQLTPVRAEQFARHYHNSFAQPHFQTVTSQLPTFMMFGNHELTNDWGGHRYPVKLPQANLEMGLRFFEAYQANHSPRIKHVARLLEMTNPPHNPPYDYQFSCGPCDVFVMDVRTERKYKSEKHPDFRNMMISPQQLSRLEQWLNTGGPVKCVVSPVPMWPDHRKGSWPPSNTAKDIWTQCLGQRAMLLKRFVHAQRNHGKNIIILSGAVHCSFLARLEGRFEGEPFSIYNFVTSAFNWPVFGPTHDSFMWEDGLRLATEDAVGFHRLSVTCVTDKVITKNSYGLIHIGRDGKDIRFEIFTAKGTMVKSWPPEG